MTSEIALNENQSAESHPMNSYGNTAYGYAALYNNNGGSYNTASGVYALYFNTAGDFNVADGHQVVAEIIGRWPPSLDLIGIGV